MNDTLSPRSADPRRQALHSLALCGLVEKLAAVHGIDTTAPIDSGAVLACDEALPGRPGLPRLVAPGRLKPRPVGNPEGRAALLHALAHIEFNAVNLALDIVWRFPGMPRDFYEDWLRVAKEEAGHFELLNAHLGTLGHAYGDFDAHDGLWEMAEKTRGDLPARLAIVPLILEARGLDASPQIRDKLASVGDDAGAAILDVILRDEIGHVAIGNRWYRYLCELRGRDALDWHAELARRYQAPRQRGPFNLAARRAAGFDEAELAALAESARPQVNRP